MFQLVIMIMNNKSPLWMVANVTPKKCINCERKK